MRLNSLALRGLLLLTVLIAGVSAARAQMDAGMGMTRTSVSSTAYYFISKPGEITMQINLWGAVKNAGRYEVPISTTLIDLLSFAGGPSGLADMSNVKVVRSVRRGVQIRRVEYELDLDRLDLLDDKAIDLEPEDTIIIDSIDWTFRDIVTVFTTTAVIIAATASIINATRR